MKTITLKIKIPNWANWVAQDEDGVWWAYENEPSRMHDHWKCTKCGATLSSGEVAIMSRIRRLERAIEKLLEGIS